MLRKDFMNFLSFLSLLLILIVIIVIDISSVDNKNNNKNNNNTLRTNNNEDNKILIVIPGGGLLKNGSLPLHSKERMNKGIELYLKLKNDHYNPFIITLSAGTPHKPFPLDQSLYPIFESSAGIQYLLSHNIPPHILLEEKLSLDTIGNAYFLRAIHTEFSRFRKLIIITNDWHMKRTRAIFETIFTLPINKYSKINEKYHLEFIEISSYLSNDILKERQQREEQSLKTFETNTKDLFHTFEDLHNWIFTKHSAYSAERFLHKVIDPTLNENILKSY